MRTKTRKYSFKAKVWKYKGPAGWHFVTLPKLLAAKIRKSHKISEEGWGRLPTTATIGGSTWKTAIWHDSKANSYLLPVKATIRKAQEIENGDTVIVRLSIQNEDLIGPIFGLR